MKTKKATKTGTKSLQAVKKKTFCKRIVKLA